VYGLRKGIHAEIGAERREDTPSRKDPFALPIIGFFGGVGCHAISSLAPFGVRWLDTAFVFYFLLLREGKQKQGKPKRCRAIALQIKTKEKKGVEPPHSKQKQKKESGVEPPHSKALKSRF
jgi:hypothetical protein